MSDYDLLRYAKQGIIIPLENLIDKYMPNLQAVFEKYPEYRTMCTAPDGHIYSFPWIEQLGAGKEAIQAIGDIPYINKKWLDYLGLEIPTTTDELEQVLIQFRDHAEELEKEFLDFCKSKNIVGVKGHRLVGGFRASTYNACTMEDVNALIAAMQEFEKAHKK